MIKTINGKLHTDETIIKQYENLVYYFAHRLKGTYETEDLASEGFIGLLKAFERYDPSRGTTFNTFARNNIYQQMCKAMRKTANGPHFPHDYVGIGWKIIRENLEGLPAADIAEQINHPVHHVERAQQYLQQRTPNGMDAVSEDGKNTMHDIIGATDDETQIYVSEFINSLDDREQTIVRCLYQEMFQHEIGEILGVSQMHVSRLIRKIGEKYREYEMEGVM